MLNAVGFIAGLIVGPIITYIDEHWGRRWGIRCEYDKSTRGAAQLKSEQSTGILFSSDLSLDVLLVHPVLTATLVSL